MIFKWKPYLLSNNFLIHSKKMELYLRHSKLLLDIARLLVYSGCKFGILTSHYIKLIIFHIEGLVPSYLYLSTFIN